MDHDREANGQALVNLKEHMERENEILRFAVLCLYILSFLAPTGALVLDIYVCLSIGLLVLFQL